MRSFQMIFLLLICSSVYSQSTPGGPPDLSIERLLTAPLQIIVDGKKLILEGSMSIDYMPSVPPRPKTVRTHCYLSTVDRSVLPLSVKADAIWIVYKHNHDPALPPSIQTFEVDTVPKIWKSWLTEDTDHHYKYKKLYRAAAGNFLGADAEADLIVRVKDDRGNKWYLRTREKVRKLY